MLEFLSYLVIAIASYRIARFLVIDTLIEGIRNKLHLFLVNRADKNGPLRLLWQKIYELTSCTWCAGFWVSAGVYAVYYYHGLVWPIIVFAIAGVQGLLHAFEPGDE